MTLMRNKMHAMHTHALPVLSYGLYVALELPMGAIPFDSNS